MAFSRLNRLTLGGASLLACALALPAQAAPPIVNGWTSFTASADTRIVYVSSSLGNDAAGGLSQSTPKRTLAAGYALLRDGYADWMLLKCGDTWNEVFPNWTKSGRNTNEMMRVGAYSTGARPLIQCGMTTGLYLGNWGAQKGHVAFTDLAFTSTYDGGASVPDGLRVLGFWTDLVFEGCYFEKFCTNVAFDADTTVPLSDIRFRRNVSVDAFKVGEGAHAQGGYFAGINGLLLEECVFDHNGWSETIPNAYPTIFRHNIYIQGHMGQPNDCTNVTTRNLISARAGATGMQQRPGGLAEGHLFLKNPLAVTFGTGGIIRNCVVMDSRDIDPTLPRGVGIELSTGSNHEAYGNICAWRTTPGTWNLTAISVDNLVTNANIHDNIVWKWYVQNCNRSTGIGLYGPAGLMQCRNNRIQLPTGGEVIENTAGTAMTASGNTYNANHSSAFWLNGNGMAFPQWSSTTGDSPSQYGQASFPDPNRTIGTYMASLGMTPSLEAFLAEARLQSKFNWRPQFTSSAVNAYIRAGFGSGTPCPADLDNNGTLNINDMVAFQKYYFRADMRADTNHDGVLNISDFTAYQAVYSAGCP